MRDSICVLSGGTGTPKLLQGLVGLVPPRDLSVVVNTADDVVVGDIHVSPDVDAVLYTLAGMIDDSKWYGIRGDTYRVYDDRCRRGLHDLLRIGDRDRENCELRTRLMAQGRSLSEATQALARKLGIQQEVWPMTDSRVVSKIHTAGGIKEFQEFWVRDGGHDEILDVTYSGIDDAEISPGARRALERAKLVVVGPSNPVTSIGPILHTGGVRKLLKMPRVVAISPIRMGAAFSGPAGKMLSALGYEVSPSTIAELYRDFLDELIIDESDSSLASSISRAFSIRVSPARTAMHTPEDKFKLARKALRLSSRGNWDGTRTRGGRAGHHR